MQVKRHSYSQTREYKECPFRWFLTYRRGWEPEKPNHHLAAGTCHHASAAAIYKEGTSGAGRSLDAAIGAAIEVFWKEWEALGMPMGEDLVSQASELKGKTPVVAEKVLAAYARARWEWLGRMELIDIEWDFERPLLIIEEEGQEPTEVRYRVRMDIILRDDWGVHPLDFKTTSQYASKGGFRPTFIKSFTPNAQCEGYLHSARERLQQQVTPLYVDAVLYHPVHRAQLVIPVNAADEEIDLWLLQQQEWSRRIVEAEERVDGGVAPEVAFPRNTESCIGKYGECRFYSLCRFHPIVSELEDYPPGFVERRWPGVEGDDA